MGARRESRALSDGRVPPPRDPLIGVGTHTNLGGKPLEGEQTTPELLKRFKGLLNHRK